ncbi:hemopexin [Osmerus mordax]|uniref:hemopexin n=1 Tax=Osmerus mordax TaxID=8014 RepID=UPI0035102CB4
MKLLFLTLWLCLALGFTSAAPSHHDRMMADPAQEETHHAAKLNRCDGVEFDAIAPDEKGNTFFFKGDHLWKGFHGPAQLSNETFKELDDYHHLGHVDAAFRMHNKENPEDHDHIYFFLDAKVFSYYNQTLEEGYPKDIQEDFPGVPRDLDAAVECPQGECITDSVLFFKGDTVYSYDIPTKSIKQKVWPHLPNCTSAFRWLEHYYCFRGNEFTRFHPVTGAVEGDYPKDARAYFMRCPNFGHGHGGRSMVPKCSEISLNAITTDSAGRSYAFRGSYYMRLDTHRDGKHAFPITRSWKDIPGAVDAVFNHNDRMYMIAGDQVYIYKSDAHYTLIEGYPKPLKEEMGIDGTVNAALLCADENIVHFIQGNKMLDVDLSATPRTVKSDSPLPIGGITAAVCGPEGVRVFVGSEYYDYKTPRLLAFSRIRVQPQKITSGMFNCED